MEARLVLRNRAGLSPLARGTHRCNGCGRSAGRFIPAGAGNTTPVTQYFHIVTVYPRWRGEHGSDFFTIDIFFGLSPLARGTPTVNFSARVTGRFIPAGAGNTSSGRLIAIIRSVYPRWRGEHPSWRHSVNLLRGLSPLARGTRLEITNERSDPAVYPRWRGEHSSASSHPASADGLSPLARGTRMTFVWDEPRPRFIPAGAGNTSRRDILPSGISVYPRWRGEHGK